MSAEIDVLYVSWNRLEFTRASFAALLDNTNWELVNRLVVHDDDSSDGSRAWLADEIGRAPVETLFSTRRFGGPVATMNWYLDLPDRPPLFAKVDNDFVMPPDWLADLWHVLDASPELDIIGTEPFVGLDTEPEVVTGSLDGAPVGYTPATHIGGKGLIRARCFEGREMWADGYQGFTQWQTRNEDVTKGWITPDIRCFGLDQLPVEKWRAITTRYVNRGVQRRWPEYAPASRAYWDWWTG